MLKCFFYSHEIISNHFHIIKEICQIQPFTGKESIVYNGKSTKFPFLITTNVVMLLCTGMRFSSFLSGVFTFYNYGSNKSTGKESGKTHLCALY